VSIAERLLPIAAGLLLTIPAEARSRCPPGEYWRPTQQGCSSKKDQPQFYTVRGSRFNTKIKLPQKPRKAEKPQTEVALTEKQVQRLERKYIAGLSAAGTAASILGAEYPDLYAAVRVQSGLACGSAHDVPSAFAAAMRQGGPVGWGRNLSREPVPTIIFHGDRDKTVHPINGDQVAVHSRAGAR